MTVVGTGGATDMAYVTHHTVRQTPDGTIYKVRRYGLHLLPMTLR